MTASKNTSRMGIAIAIMALTVLTLAPAASAAGSDQLSGWEQTSNGRGVDAAYDNGQKARAAATGSTVAEPHGWEATTTATQRSVRVVGEPSGPEVFPITTILLYTVGGLAALIVAFGVTRTVRSHRRPPRVA